MRRILKLLPGNCSGRAAVIELFKRRQPRTALGLRLSRAIAEEEERGRSFAFRARLVAVVTVMLYLLLVIEPQRQLYYLAVTAAFLLLGFGIRQAMRPADRQRGLLMIGCGIVFIANVLIWTV